MPLKVIRFVLKQRMLATKVVYLKTVSSCYEPRKGILMEFIRHEAYIIYEAYTADKFFWYKWTNILLYLIFSS